MTIPTWPLGLPYPLQDGFQRQPKAPFVRTEMDGGMARTRRRFRVFPITVSISFFLNRDEYDVFIGFCRDTIHGYSDWFMVTIDGPGGVGQKRARWLEPPGETKVGEGHWRISGQIETMSNF
ncbi:MAG: hypothetical protein ABN482_09755 [Corticimicrobacter sp.]|uniref:hypothetical protein n=1 Tax=Corticimicrobacter sp. TaxID=2678536 RepID=UPI0032DB188E